MKIFNFARVCIGSITLFLLGSPASSGQISSGQQAPQTQPSIAQLEREIAVLRGELDALRATVRQLQTKLAASDSGERPKETKAKAEAMQPLQVSNTRIQETIIGAQMIGEIKNNTGRDYAILIVKFRFYNKAGDLLEVSQVNLANFPAGSQKAIEVPIEHTKPQDIASYKLDADAGF